MFVLVLKEWYLSSLSLIICNWCCSQWIEFTCSICALNQFNGKPVLILILKSIIRSKGHLIGQSNSTGCHIWQKSGAISQKGKNMANWVRATPTMPKVCNFANQANAISFTIFGKISICEWERDIGREREKNMYSTSIPFQFASNNWRVGNDPSCSFLSNNFWRVVVKVQLNRMSITVFVY